MYYSSKMRSGQRPVSRDKVAGMQKMVDKNHRPEGNALNRKVDQQAALAPADPPAEGGPRRRTWEGFADDYRALSEQLMEMTARQQQAIDQIRALEREVGSRDSDLKRLKAQRQKDLDRLAAVSRTRDLLEKRASAQMAKVAAAVARPAPPSAVPPAAILPPPAQAIEPEQTAAPAAVAIPAQADGFVALYDDSRKVAELGWSDKRWWLRTIGMAQKAQKERRLSDAQLYFEAAIVTRPSASLWEQLGHVLRESGQFLEAELAYRRSLGLKPGRGEPLFLSGYCLEMAGRWAEAIPLYEAALASEPALADRYEHLRDFRARLGG